MLSIDNIHNVDSDFSDSNLPKTTVVLTSDEEKDEYDIHGECVSLNFKLTNGSNNNTPKYNFAKTTVLIPSDDDENENENEYYKSSNVPKLTRRSITDLTDNHQSINGDDGNTSDDDEEYIPPNLPKLIIGSNADPSNGKESFNYQPINGNGGNISDDDDEYVPPNLPKLTIGSNADPSNGKQSFNYNDGNIRLRGESTYELTSEGIILTPTLYGHKGKMNFTRHGRNRTFPRTNRRNFVPNVSNNIKKENLIELSELGRGSTAVVTKMLDIIELIFYARKEYRIADAGKRHQLVHELDAFQRLDSPYVIKFRGAYALAQKKRVYLLMEYMNGGSLKHFVDNHTRVLPEFVIKHCALQLVKGFMYLHKRKEIHRDVKPENILVSLDGAVKISDFGLLKTLTRPKTVSYLGTGFYLSPERANCDSYSFPADIWGLGLCVVYCATGECPFSSANEWDRATEIKKGYSLRSYQHRTFSEEMYDFVDQCLAIDPLSRAKADDLLKHPFLKNKGDSQNIIQFFQEAKRPIEDDEFETLITEMSKIMPINHPELENTMFRLANLSQYEPNEMVKSTMKILRGPKIR